MQPIAEVFNGGVADGLGQDGPGYNGAEINKAGKVVYGYNLYIKDITTLRGDHTSGTP